MSSSNRITRLLQKHKGELSRVDLEPILVHLVKKRVISREEQLALGSGDQRVEKLIELLPTKGFNAFREFCVILEMDCPHLLTSLLMDSNGSCLKASWTWRFGGRT